MNYIPYYFYGEIFGYTKCNSTIYKVKTLNAEGYYELLKIALDALFNPIFEKSKFKTEVYHVDNNGNENGRIYHEMRSIGYDLIKNWVKQKNTLPKLTFEQILTAYKKYYRMDNCVLTIIGRVNRFKVLDIIENFEKLNRCEKLLYLIPNELFNLKKFEGQINIFNCPPEMNYGYFYTFWKFDAITVKFN